MPHNPAMSASPRKVALFIVSPSGSGQKLLEGIAGFHPGSAPWSVVVVQGTERRLVEGLTEWRGDGVICTARTPEMVAAAAALRCPVVNLAGRLDDLPLPSVLTDDRGVGVTAARYLLDRGFERFAYVGGDDAFSIRRGEGFERAIAGAGHPPPARFRRGEQDEAFAAWLTDVEYPAAVFTKDDYAGHHALVLCQQRGVQVPEQVAVLGVNDLWWLCELAYPPLSSVDAGVDRRGREAAALLERLMDGGPAPVAPVRVPPVGVVTRRSTDIIAVDDPDIVRALQFIRERYHHGVGVDDVADHVMLSRRTLERRFAEQFYRSLNEELRRVRIEAAKRLLRGTELSMLQVALRAGFRGPLSSRPRSSATRAARHRSTAANPTPLARREGSAGLEQSMKLISRVAGADALGSPESAVTDAEFSLEAPGHRRLCPGHPGLCVKVCGRSHTLAPSGRGVIPVKI